MGLKVNKYCTSTSTLSVHKVHDTSISEPVFLFFVLAYWSNLCMFRIKKDSRFTFYQDLKETRMTSEPQKDIGPHLSMLLPLGSTSSFHMKSDFHCQKASEAMPASATAKKKPTSASRLRRAPVLLQTYKYPPPPPLPVLLVSVDTGG